MARPKMSEEEAEAVKRYKEILKDILESRPAGTRQRLAIALGTTRSFISQISNPAYPIPIPAHHIPTIAQICLFTKQEMARFKEAHAIAHPEQAAAMQMSRSTRVIALAVPDFEDPKKNKQLEAMLADFVREMSSLFEQQ